MAFSLYKFLVKEWKVLEITDYYTDDKISSWHIYGKLFGLFWVELFKNKTFISPHSFYEVNCGYRTPGDALHKITSEVGNKTASKNSLIVRKDPFNPKYNENDVFRYSVIKSRNFHKEEKYSVAKGFYFFDRYNETFVILESIVDGCDSPKEAIMKASLMGITVDNPNRFRK